jgi:hypothetical protein
MFMIWDDNVIRLWGVNRCVVIDKKDRTLGVDAWKGLYLSIRPTQNCLSLIAGQIRYHLTSKSGFSF